MSVEFVQTAGELRPGDVVLIPRKGGGSRERRLTGRPGRMGSLLLFGFEQGNGATGEWMVREHDGPWMVRRH